MARNGQGIGAEFSTFLMSSFISFNNIFIFKIKIVIIKKIFAIIMKENGIYTKSETILSNYTLFFI